MRSPLSGFHKLILPILCLITFMLDAQKQAPSGGGSVDLQSENCISPAQTAAIIEQLKINIEQLKLQGLLSEAPVGNEVVTQLGWPMKQAPGFDQYDYYNTSNFLDLDPSSVIQDYNCGSRSYDGHNGIDYSLWPYWWKMMDEDQVQVIAGAPGTIVFKQDGNFDRNCICQGTWNAVYIRHADESIAWYGHLKTNSLLEKGVGETVAEGEYLGLIGSSGCSSNPHLHLELRDANMNVVDPTTGPCNNNQSSWWQDQKPYIEPGLNLLMTHSIEPAFNGFCPEEEEPDFQTAFEANEWIRFAAYYHDQINTETTQYRILNPNGVSFAEWTHASQQYYSSSFWYWNYQIPASAPAGTWTFEASFMGNQFNHEFTVGMDVGTSDLETNRPKLFPNPTQDNLQIAWNNFAPINYQLRNTAGEIVKSGRLNSAKEIISLIDLTAGIYFLEFVGEKKMAEHREKIIKLSRR